MRPFLIAGLISLAVTILFLFPPDCRADVPHVYLSGVVDNESATDTAKQFVAALAESPKAIVLEISSPGGSVHAGMLLSRFLEHSPVPVICLVDSEAYSMAFYILQAGCNVRLAVKQATLMTHHVSVREAKGTSEDLRKAAKEMDVLEEAMDQKQGARIKGGPKALKAMVEAGGGELWLTAYDALAIGALDGVVDSFRDADAWAERAG